MIIANLFVSEHISLEEISSDSNDEMSKPKKKKKHDLKKGRAIVGWTTLYPILSTKF